MTGKAVCPAVLIICAILLGGCREDDIAARPDTVELTNAAAAHYCQMIVLDHPGPKAQIHLAGNPNPLWFTQIRDAVAFALLPEETNKIAAIYVNDMAEAEWEAPGSANWILADKAVYVIESGKLGGMGAPEAIPFGERSAAEKFVARHGGRIVGFAGIPGDYVLSPVEVSELPPETEG